jgi:hypothetical protein
MLRLRRSAFRPLATAGVLLGAAVLMAIPSPERVSAKEPEIFIREGGIVISGGGGSSMTSTVALPEDRDKVRRLRAAKDLIELKKYSEAVSTLGKLLETSEDYFFKPDADAKNHLSMRWEVERLIGSMPEEGRRQYELRFGPAAQKLLTEGLASGSWQALEDVTRRYFHTESGYQAAWLLAEYRLDSTRGSRWWRPRPLSGCGMRRPRWLLRWSRPCRSSWPPVGCSCSGKTAPRPCWKSWPARSPAHRSSWRIARSSSSLPAASR